MSRTAFHDDARAKQRKEQRLKRRAGNRVTTALDTLPDSVKRECMRELRGDASDAFHRLLVGASHVCPECGHDAGPKSKNGTVYACGCERPNVNALRLYFELTGDVGPANQVIVNVAQQLGVATLEEAARFIAGGRTMQALADTTPEAAGDDAVEVLRLVAAKVDPETRRRWRGSLSGLWPEAESLQSHEDDRTSHNGGVHEPGAK